MYLHCQNISLFLNIWCQIKLRRCEAVLCITYKLTIKPQIHSFFYTFEADMYSFSTHVLIQIKVFDIRAYRIVLCFWEHSFFCSGCLHTICSSVVLFSFPRIHSVDVTYFIISSQFNMSRNHNFIESWCIKCFLIKINWSALYIFTIKKLPLAV